VLAQWNNSQSADRNVAPNQTHYPDSEPTILCSFSLMLCAKRRSRNYQCFSLWLDSTGARSHDLPHSRRPLHHNNYQCTPPMRFGRSWGRVLVVSNQRLCNWYMLVLRWTHNIKECRQRLVGSESGHYIHMEQHIYPWFQWTNAVKIQLRMLVY